LGLQPPYASLGTLAFDGFQAIESFPHLFFFPASFIFLTLFSFQSIGDQFAQLIDPNSG
jgi:ABC-type dipeptide/oligopeptide/nickel transport system permease subunit